MAETVYSGSVEPDQANTCEGNRLIPIKVILSLRLVIITLDYFVNDTSNRLNLLVFE